MNYKDKITQKQKEYFDILGEWPDWLDEYINTDSLKRIDYISYDCGCDYTNLFKHHDFYSNLDHSVGVALIMWHFTHDKKQTLAGLFHDIATPVFKHCIDFMNGDYLTQESTEELTKHIIEHDAKIMELLTRDNILVEEVCEYGIYPIADNKTPRLSADRFEYNFCTGVFIHPEVWTDLKDLEECYQDVEIFDLGNEVEMGFKHEKTALKYLRTVSNLWPYWVNDTDRISMQFIADMCKRLSIEGILTKNDLYTLKESEVIDIIKTSEDEYLKVAFKNFQNATKCYQTDKVIPNKYTINVKSKRRYLDPLVDINGEYKRLTEVSKEAQEIIENYFNVRNEGLVYLDFEFDPSKKLIKTNNTNI